MRQNFTSTTALNDQEHQNDFLGDERYQSNCVDVSARPDSGLMTNGLNIIERNTAVGNSPRPVRSQLAGLDVRSSPREGATMTNVHTETVFDSTYSYSGENPYSSDFATYLENYGGVMFGMRESAAPHRLPGEDFVEYVARRARNNNHVMVDESISHDVEPINPFEQIDDEPVILAVRQPMLWDDSSHRGREIIRLSIYGDGDRSSSMLTYRDGHTAEVEELLRNHTHNVTGLAFDSSDDDHSVDSTVSTAFSAIPDDEWEGILAMRIRGTAFCYTLLACGPEDQRRLAYLDANPTLELIFGSEWVWRMFYSNRLVTSFYLTKIRGNWHLTTYKYRRYSKQFRTADMFVEIGCLPNGLSHRDWTRRTVGATKTTDETFTSGHTFDTGSPTGRRIGDPNATYLDRVWWCIALYVILTARMGQTFCSWYTVHYVMSWALAQMTSHRQSVPGFCADISLPGMSFGLLPSYNTVVGVLKDNPDLVNENVEVIMGPVIHFRHTIEPGNLRAYIERGPVWWGFLPVGLDIWYDGLIFVIHNLMPGEWFWKFLVFVLLVGGVRLSVPSYKLAIRVSKRLGWRIRRTSVLMTVISVAALGSGFCGVSLPIVLLVLAVCNLSASINSPDPDIKMLTFGSRGDRIPLLYYTELMRKIGYRAERLDILDDDAGRTALASVEEGRFYEVIPKLTPMPALIQKYSSDPATHVFAPQAALGARGNITTFELAPPPSQLKAWRMGNPNVNPLFYPINFLFRLSHLLSGPDIRFGSFEGCAPRSPDGVNLLKPRHNRGLRDTIVVMGSSSEEEPKDLPLETTWSTRANSRYKYEPDTNHPRMFAKYKRAITHGGAGTMATAAASGCEVQSASLMIDRQYVDHPDFTFTQDTFDFWYGFGLNLSLEGRILLCRRLMKLGWLLAFRLAVCLTLRSAMSQMVIANLLVRWAISFSLRLSPIVDLPGFVAAIIQTGLGMDNSLFVLMSVSLIMRVALAKQRPKERIEVAATIVGELFTVLGWMGKSPIWASCMAHAPPLIVIVAFWVFMLLQKELWCHAVNGVLKTLATAVFTNDPFKERILIRFTRVKDTSWDWLPLYHAEYVEPQTLQSAGVTVRKRENGVMECAYEERDAPKNYSWDMYTPIHRDHWDYVKCSLKRKNGTLYTPLNNCQTSVLQTRMQVGNGIDAACLMIIVGGSVSIVSVLGLLFSGMLAVFGGFGFILAKTPILTALGEGVAFDDLRSLMIFLISPSISAKYWTKPDQVNQIVKTTRAGLSDAVVGVFEGPVRVHSSVQYPTTEPMWGPFRPSSPRLMRIKVGSTLMDYNYPMLGVSRPQYELGRGGTLRYIHSLSDAGLKMNVSPRQMALLKELRERLEPYKGNVALVAATGERTLQEWVLSWLKERMEHVIVLTNDNRIIPGCDVMRFEATGRELATMRLGAQSKSDTLWWSFNSELTGICQKGPDLLWSHFTKKGCDGVISAAPYGLHPTAAGICAYNKTVLFESSLNFEIYGSDEWALTKIPGTIVTLQNKEMFCSLFKETNFKCSRTIVILDKDGDKLVNRFKVTTWSAETILAGMRKTLCVELTGDGMLINGNAVNMAPIVSEMYPQGTPVELVAQDIARNPGAFAKRCGNALTGAMEECRKRNSKLPAPLVSSLYTALEAFDRSKRPPKNPWAFVQNQLRKHRVEELDVDLHPNPVFIKASYQDTLKYYVDHINFSHRSKALNPSEFRRRVNTSAHVDLWLKEKLPDAFDKGVDGSIIACKEVMLASLSRYLKGSPVDALTDERVDRIAQSMYKANPLMFDNASIADPRKLGKKFLSFKKYSAGLPFTYEGSGIKKRSDLRKQGYLQPLVDVGMLPYKTGKWYPAISHAFPKSQVIPVHKLHKDLGKMRSIVATAGFINIQQGILNFDLNNRHNYIGTNEKVGMPTDGTHMNMVFSDLEQCSAVYSADVTAMDASLTDGVFKVIANLRSKGFESHPAYETIKKHIQCSIEQSKHAYVINLIDKSVDRSNIEQTIGPVDDEVFDRLLEQSSGKGFISDPTAPGGVLVKEHGGSTGDANVTFVNTKALPVILMYGVCETHDISYEEFYSEIVLHNFGDDNLFGPTSKKIDVGKVIKKVKEDLNVELRIESKGQDIYSQEFLGKRPCPVEAYRHEFVAAGIEVPKYAIRVNGDTLRLRLAREKADASRHKGISHEMYRIEKALGYVYLSAHDKELYDLLTTYIDEVKGRIPLKTRDAGWFKRKFKVPSYVTVIKKWYKDPVKGVEDVVHGVTFKASRFVKTEKMFMRVLNALGWIADQFPAHLFNLDDSKTLARQSRTSGVVEAHAWHCYVHKNGTPPTLTQLKGLIEKSPFSAFADAEYWYVNHGAALPTQGDIFKRNNNYATFRLLLYSTIYYNVNKCAGVMNRLPMGNVMTEVFNLAMFKSRNMFGAFGFAYYVGHADSSPVISGLVPKDPYLYHKQAAQIIESWLPHCSTIGLVPWSLMSHFTADTGEKISRFLNTTMVAPRPAAMTGSTMNGSPWKTAVTEAMNLVLDGQVPLIVAHTGTGKTRYCPDLILNNQVIPTTNVIVVMPRRIAAEQWSKTSGALWKRLGVKECSTLTTMTYGYLAHCHVHSIRCFNDDTIFIFDEAHEESVEWRYLRKHFVVGRKCVCLTATPMALPCKGMPKVYVDIKPIHEIEDVDLDVDVYDAIKDFKKVSNRMCVIEPALRKCKEIASAMAADGMEVKIVHRNDRSIPETGHLVCTSVVESSITIPGCDVVIDTGERIVNDGGDIKRLPNTTAGSTQRRGRTGRTNKGVYVRLVKPQDVEYNPTPDINMVLEDHDMSAGTGVSHHLTKTHADAAWRIHGDNYAVLQQPVKDEQVRKNVSLIHKLMLQHTKWSDVQEAFTRLGQGQAEATDHLLKVCDIRDLSELLTFEVVRGVYLQAEPTYYVGSIAVGHVPIIKGWGISFMDKPESRPCKKNMVRHNKGA